MVLERGAVRAGRVLLLVGGIVQLLVGVATLVIGAYFAGLLGGSTTAPAWIGWAEIVLGVLSIVGGEVALRAFRRARSGDLAGAGVLGFIACLLPPVALLTLIGAILCYSSRPKVPDLPA